MVRLLHIAPELPPAVGGVADYTAILTRRLVEESGAAVDPVLVHAGRQPADAIDVDVSVVDLSGQCSASALAETIGCHARGEEEQAVVVVEYAGYGYAKSGAPLWLLRGLRRARRSRTVSLITVFHELYAKSLRPWTRTFWTMPVQYFVATRLARLSDGLTANWSRVARWLSRRVDGTPVHLSPSFSNVGEPEDLPPFTERDPYAICFGGAGKKATLYEEYGPEVSRILQKRGIERIIDVGPDVPDEAVSSLTVPAESKGILPEQEVSVYLQNASLGLLNYGLHCLRKSGVWGSYAAHGLPVLLAAERQPIENLDEGKHFVLLGSGQIPEPEQLEAMSRAVRQWYDEVAHSRRAAQRLMGIISSL